MWYLRIHLCCCRLFLCVRLFTRHSGEPQKHLHGNKSSHGACVLHRRGQHIAEVGVEVLFIVGGQAQALESSAFGVALNLFHQSPAIALPSLRPGHNHRLDEQAAVVTYHPGEACVADQPLCLSVALQENQADGELWTGFLEGVNPGGLAPLPLGVDQVRTGNQQVRSPVDRDCTDLL